MNLSTFHYLAFAIIILCAGNMDHPENFDGRKLDNHYYHVADSISNCLLENRPIKALPDQRFVYFNYGAGIGIGNLLFFYAAARSVAVNFNKTYLKNRLHPVLEWFSFDIDCKGYYSDQVSYEGHLDVIEDHGLCFKGSHAVNVLTTVNYEISHGYFQRYGIFDSQIMRRVMYEGLKVRPPLATAAEDFMQIYKDRVYPKAEIVCAHIRLGDMMGKDRDYSTGKRLAPTCGWMPDPAYIKIAMEWFDEKLKKNNVYLFFTESLDVLKNWNITKYTTQSVTYAGDHLHHHPHNSSIIEFEILLNHCDHLLLSKGTFGWWPGWKSKGYVLFSEYENVINNKKIQLYSDQYIPPNFHLVYPCQDDVDKYCGVREPRDPSWNDWKKAMK